MENILGPSIKRIRKEKHLTQKDLGKMTGFSQNTVSQHESGSRVIDEKAILKYSQALGVTPQELFNSYLVKESLEKNRFIKDPCQTNIDNTVDILKKLEEPRQQNVYNYANNQLKEQNGKVVNLPLVGKSAANPTELTYGDVEIEHDDFTDVPHGADTAIRIQGDSMEPLIHDGQIIFYHQQEEVENGEIAIVEIDGDGVTCKQICYDYTSDEVILRSINKKYEPRRVKDDQVRIIGRVIL
ncbi:helix-turn-helix domain-containing protein [Loigolactobacillus coryniformis subsp. coryniformis]|uniref:helix-turn-helix domain-containing protein n=1 Tax=Loigolactobacillus coryniformis TaxID=1610 RepID=UPI0039938D15